MDGNSVVMYCPPVAPLFAGIYNLIPVVCSWELQCMSYKASVCVCYVRVHPPSMATASPTGYVPRHRGLLFDGDKKKCELWEEKFTGYMRMQ